MYSRILISLDGSELAEHAVTHAVEIARRFGARLTILRVISPIVAAVEVEYAPSAYEQVMEAETEAAQSYVKEMVEKLTAESITVDGEALVGNPAATIVDYAHDIGASLIVMATHGRSGLARWVMGSVADHVLRESGVPVLLVRTHPEKH